MSNTHRTVCAGPCPLHPAGYSDSDRARTRRPFCQTTVKTAYTLYKRYGIAGFRKTIPNRPIIQFLWQRQTPTPPRPRSALGRRAFGFSRRGSLDNLSTWIGCRRTDGTRTRAPSPERILTGGPTRFCLMPFEISAHVWIPLCLCSGIPADLPAPGAPRAGAMLRVYFAVHGTHPFLIPRHITAGPIPSLYPRVSFFPFVGFIIAPQLLIVNRLFVNSSLNIDFLSYSKRLESPLDETVFPRYNGKEDDWQRFAKSSLGKIQRPSARPETEYGYGG